MIGSGVYINTFVPVPQWGRGQGFHTDLIVNGDPTKPRSDAPVAFVTYYNNNGRRAGTYELSGLNWTYNP